MDRVVLLFKTLRFRIFGLEFLARNFRTKIFFSLENFILKNFWPKFFLFTIFDLEFSLDNFWTETNFCPELLSYEIRASNFFLRIGPRIFSSRIFILEFSA